ncbi:MAG TPA: zinc-binding alcohol dehydrogenase family protein [Methylotenera sp.]|nr:zinc-binding alcohol dehydrogenase family protein [Methylotenera sp.]
MKAVAFQHSLPITDSNALVDINLPDPIANGHDLLVEVKAVSVNPVDVKKRAGAKTDNDNWKVLGWDATGIVRAVGPNVTMFKPCDRVWYAGSITRPGSNSELQLVDERIVGKMPNSLGFAEAAALPLTSLTAWEMLFDRFNIPQGKTTDGQSLLIIGAAGGVGSIMTQLARRLTNLNVIGTASRPETQAWVQKAGAHYVIDHSLPFGSQLEKLGLGNPEYIVSLTHTDQHFEQIAEVIAPQGKFGLIDDPDLFDVRKLKRKSVSLHWELMFTRSIFNTSDIATQHNILTEIAKLIDNGVIRTTVADNFGKINAANLKRAHTLIESGKSRGKIVLEGF